MHDRNRLFRGFNRGYVAAHNRSTYMYTHHRGAVLAPKGSRPPKRVNRDVCDNLYKNRDLALRDPSALRRNLSFQPSEALIYFFVSLVKPLVQLLDYATNNHVGPGPPGDVSPGELAGESLNPGT